jgi:hypothetical protein
MPPKDIESKPARKFLKLNLLNTESSKCEYYKFGNQHSKEHKIHKHYDPGKTCYMLELLFYNNDYPLFLLMPKETQI